MVQGHNLALVDRNPGQMVHHMPDWDCSQGILAVDRILVERSPVGLRSLVECNPAVAGA